jgi:hypothetical protein
MATGAANMRALERQLQAVPDEAVAELVRWFVPRSEAVGGRMQLRGRSYKLSSRIRSRKSRVSSSSVILGGTPAGAWAIKSYGRRGGYDVRPRRREALKLSAFAPGVFFFHVTVRSSTGGDRRWERLVVEADMHFPDVVADVVGRKVVRL